MRYNITNFLALLAVCQQLRNMSDKRRMVIKPTRYEWTRFKDHLVSYQTRRSANIDMNII